MPVHSWAQLLHSYNVVRFSLVVGPAKDRTERPDPPDGDHAHADQHQPDHALLQQPHDVLPDQHQVSAGHKPKTHGRGVQPRCAVTVRVLEGKLCLSRSQFSLSVFS